MSGSSSSRPTCKICGRNPGRLGRKNKDGTKYYRDICGSCAQRKSKGLPGPASQNYPANGHVLKQRDKGWHCEECGFKAKDQAQLDVDHIDGNSANNSWDNQQVLCANCHRLKTITNGDHLTPIGANGHDRTQGDLFS